MIPNPQLNDDPHSFAVGLIAEIRDPLDLLVLDKFRDLLDQISLVDKVREFRHDDAVLAAAHCLYIGDSSRNDLSSSGPVGLISACRSHDNTAGGKIRRFYNGKKLVDLGIPVFVDPVVNDLYDRVDDFP